MSLTSPSRCDSRHVAANNLSHGVSLARALAWLGGDVTHEHYRRTLRQAQRPVSRMRFVATRPTGVSPTPAMFPYRCNVGGPCLQCHQSLDSDWGWTDGCVDLLLIACSDEVLPRVVC